MQVLESVPTISVEKTDGCQMYLSKGNNPEIISAKSSEMNVIIPTDDDDYVSYYCPRHLFLKFEIVETEPNSTVNNALALYRWSNRYLNNSKLSSKEQNWIQKLQKVYSHLFDKTKLS